MVVFSTCHVFLVETFQKWCAFQMSMWYLYSSWFWIGDEQLVTYVGILYAMIRIPSWTNQDFSWNVTRVLLPLLTWKHHDLGDCKTSKTTRLQVADPSKVVILRTWTRAIQPLKRRVQWFLGIQPPCLSGEATTTPTKDEVKVATASGDAEFQGSGLRDRHSFLPTGLHFVDFYGKRRQISPYMDPMGYLG